MPSLSIIINTSVFMANMTVEQSFRTNLLTEFIFLMSSSEASLETRVKCVVSDLDVTSKAALW